MNACDHDFGRPKPTWHTKPSRAADPLGLTALLAIKYGATCRIRTDDLLITRVKLSDFVEYYQVVLRSEKPCPDWDFGICVLR